MENRCRLGIHPARESVRAGKAGREDGFFQRRYQNTCLIVRAVIITTRRSIRGRPAGASENRDRPKAAHSSAPRRVSCIGPA